MNSLVTDGLTYITPLGLGFTLAMGLLMIVLPRRYALVPVIILTCYMTMGERVMVVGLNFTMIRILMLFGWARLLLRRELRRLQLNQIDRMMFWWTLAAVVTYTLLWGTWDSLVDRLGLAYNAIGLYFLFRFLLQGFDDFIRCYKIYAVLILPLAVSMVLERLTGRNSFSVFGGVPLFTVIRDGALRCQGPFAHPILAGTFGAVLVPFFVALWLWGGKNKLLAVVGIISSVAITITSASSGPIFTFLSGVLGMGMWLLRNHMKEVRRGIVLMLVSLQIVMKAPVWFLLARVDIVNGSTGYHRAYLIDRAIANFSDWWLIGTRSTVHWADASAHLFDVTNQYIIEGAEGGLLTMLLFVAIIVRCFRGVGLAVRALEGESRKKQFALWAMGASLLAHAMTYISVSYFDQNIVNWYLLLAMISTASAVFVAVPQPEPERAAVPKWSSLRGLTPGQPIIRKQ